MPRLPESAIADVDAGAVDRAIVAADDRLNRRSPLIPDQSPNLRDNPALMEEISRKVLEKRGLLTPPPTPEVNGEMPEPPAKAEPKSRRQPAAAE